MLIKKQISYIAEIVVAAWIAKVDFVDGQSQFNYGFTVESEEEEQSTNEKVTITLALRDALRGDVFVIGKTTILGSTNIKWYVVEDQTSFREIKKETAFDEYQGGVDDRANECNEYITIESISTHELKAELLKRIARADKKKQPKKAMNISTPDRLGLKVLINKNYNET